MGKISRLSLTMRLSYVVHEITDLMKENFVRLHNTVAEGVQETFKIVKLTRKYLHTTSGSSSPLCLIILKEGSGVRVFSHLCMTSTV
jgi:hypothetical protein